LSGERHSLGRLDGARRLFGRAWAVPIGGGACCDRSGPSAWAFAAIVAALHLAVVTFATATHEMWRDELHCWLVARDSATPWQVVRERAYDGQPPLWYWLLWLLTRVTWHPELMRVVHVAIATSAVLVIARFAPFGRAPRALFAFGYFVAYEYAALSRCYGLALLFALILCANHERRFERPVLTGCLLGAMALTTTVATLVVVAYCVALVVDWGVTDSDSRSRWTRPATIAALAASATVAAGLCAWPPSDSTVAHVGRAPEMPWDFAPTRVVAALMAVPRPNFFFWNSNAFLDAIPIAGLRFALSIGLFAWGCFVLSRDRFAVVLFGTATVLLVLLFKEVYSGSVRHHGFIFVAFLMGAWIAAGKAPRAAQSGRWRTLRDRALGPTLLAVLALQVPGAAIAIAFDARYVFSSGKRAADELRSRGLDDALIVAEVDFPATAMLGQLGPRAIGYSPRTGRPFSFVKWTADRLWEPTDEQSIGFAQRFGASHGQDVVLVMNRPLLPPLIDGTRVVRLAEKYDSMIEEENFYIYRVKRATDAEERPE
jgi:hypothetical protein